MTTSTSVNKKSIPVSLMELPMKMFNFITKGSSSSQSTYKGFMDKDGNVKYGFFPYFDSTLKFLGAVIGVGVAGYVTIKATTINKG